MTRAKAVELLAGAALEGFFLPAAETELTWHTRVVNVGAEADALISAMEQLRDERWVLASVTPLPFDTNVGAGVQMACVFRRLSIGEEMAMRQSTPMVVDHLRGRS